MTNFDCISIAGALGELYENELAGDQLVALAPSHNRRLCLRITIEDQKQRHRWIFEAGVTRPEKKVDEPAARKLVLEFIAAYLSQWFGEDRSIRPSLNFQAHSFGKQEVFLRGRRRDLRADRLAADFLGEPMDPDLDEVK
jgi:hypothetical protein